MKPAMPPQPMTRSSQAAGIVIPHEPRRHQRVLAWLIYALVRVVAATVRFRLRDRSGLFEGPPPGPAIYCLWHNRLALGLAIYYRYLKPRSRSSGVAAMVSASRDGAFLAAILKCYSVQPVRGSSSRRGPQALLELTTWAERGYDLAITPDGPRGPCYVVQEGVMSLAQLTGLPVVPVNYRLGFKLRLKSWDRFLIPLPFTRCEVFFEKAVRVPRDASDAQREEIRRQIQETLSEIVD